MCIRDRYTTAIMGANKTQNELTKPGRFAKMGNAIMAGFKVAGAGARIFGAALINAIPLIGQIIFAVGLLVQGFGFLFGKAKELAGPMTELEKIADTMSDKFEQLDKAIEKSNKRMKESSDAAEINAEKGLQQRIGYEVLNGVVSETADAFTRYATAMGKQDLSFMDRFVSFISQLAGSVMKAATSALNAFLQSLKDIGTWFAESTLGSMALSFFGDVGTAASEMGKKITDAMFGPEELAEFNNLVATFEGAVGAIYRSDTTGKAKGVFETAMGDGKGSTKTLEEFTAELRKNFEATGDVEAARTALNLSLIHI